DIIIQFKLGWSIFLSTFFVSMYTTSIPLILGYNSGAEAVGIYNAADKLKQALQGLIGPVSQAIYPRSNRLMHESRPKAIKFVASISKILILLMLISCLFVFSFSDQIVQLAFGVGNADTSAVLKIIIWIPILVALANMLGIQVMLPMGLSKTFGITYVIIGTLGLPLMFLGSYYGSYIGVSI
ncbi:oligosaccharide flippase family protein, partial [Providencia heimbachae]